MIGSQRALTLISVLEKKSKDLRLQVQLLASQQFFNMDVSAEEREEFLRYCVAEASSKPVDDNSDSDKKGASKSGQLGIPLRKQFEYMIHLLIISKDATTV